MKRFIEEADSTLKCNDVMTRVVDQGCYFVLAIGPTSR
jgi:hypothetical protein